MQSLDAALAFAITMLILSMVVTTIVETLHRLSGLREKGLELMLASFYDRVLAARGAAPADPDSRLAFVAAMSANRAPSGDRIGALWRGHRLDKLGVMAFMERLGGTDIGASIVFQAAAGGEAGVSAALKDISQKFEAFGREASVYFESRARLVSVIVGFVLAFAINVNAFTLFDTFLRNPNVTRAVIEQGSAAQKAYDRLNTDVNGLNASIAPAKSDQRAKAQNAAGKAQVDEALEKVDAAREELRKAVEGLQGIGVPLGWDERSRQSFSDNLAGALAGLLLGGLLIGLGAPFWYDAVGGLTRLRTPASARDAKAAAFDALPAGSAPAAQPQTPIEAFAAARAAADVTRAPRPPEEPVG